MSIWDDVRQVNIRKFIGAAAIALLAISATASWADESVATTDIIKSSDQIIDEMMGTRGFGLQARAILDVKFEYDSALLTDQARSQLEQLAGALQSKELMRFKYELVGHTSSDGSTDHNQVLSEARAQSAFAYLTKIAGIDANRLTESGYGESVPLDKTDTESPVNRRVEVIEVGEYQP